MISPSIEDVFRRIVREENERLEQRLRAQFGSGAAEDELLTPEEAAAVAKVSPATLRRWTSSRGLRKCGSGRAVRIRRGDLVAFLSGGRTLAPAARQTAEDRADEILGRRARRG